MYGKLKLQTPCSPPPPPSLIEYYWVQFVVGKSHFLLKHVHVHLRLKKIQEKKKIIKKKAEEAKKAKGITNGKKRFYCFENKIK